MFQPSHESYRYNFDPPLKLPVKSVVAARNYDVWYGPTRRLCFEDRPAFDSRNKSANNGHTKRMCIDDYSRIISEEAVSRRLNSEHFHNKFHSNLPRKNFNVSHQPPATVDECANTTSERQLKKRLH
jgi:hypothetical protein